MLTIGLLSFPDFIYAETMNAFAVKERMAVNSTVYWCQTIHLVPFVKARQNGVGPCYYQQEKHEPLV